MIEKLIEPSFILLIIHLILVFLLLDVLPTDEYYFLLSSAGCIFLLTRDKESTPTEGAK